MPKVQPHAQGFTLVELLVTIVIIGILAGLTTIIVVQARVKARDVRRITDIKTLQTALEFYKTSEGSYPNTLPNPGDPLVGSFGEIYMNSIPSNPQPWDDGDCESPGSDYQYTKVDNSFTIIYCLGAGVQGIDSGPKVATPYLIAEDYVAPIPPLLAECTGSNVKGDFCGGGLLISTSPMMVGAPPGCTAADGSGCNNDYTEGVGFSGSDTLTLQWSTTLSTITGSNDQNNGLLNSCHTITSPVHPACNLCWGLNLNGFDDWYLPSYNEWDNFRSINTINATTAPAMLGITSTSAYYWTSTDAAPGSPAYAYRRRITSTVAAYPKTSSIQYFRCMRRPVL